MSDPAAMLPGGAFVVSLDFELHWGLRDHTPISANRDRLLGARRAVEVLLELFGRRGIHATWATVGMLFAHDRAELMRFLPSRRPRYADARLDPYAELSALGVGESDDPFHFAGALVDRIAATPGQELATHTFSHFYCLEPGVDAEDFEADLVAARRIGERHGDTLRSIVFPRNQVNPAFGPVLDKVGVRSFRVNPPHWAYDAHRNDGETAWRRAARLADAYAPVVRDRTAGAPVVGDGSAPFPASAFLRPYSPRLRALDGLRLRRIENEMRSAARSGRMFHLWWHPHNFGTHLRENVRFLEAVLDVFETLRRTEGMASATMDEVRMGGGVAG